MTGRPPIPFFGPRPDYFSLHFVRPGRPLTRRVSPCSPPCIVFGHAWRLSTSRRLGHVRFACVRPCYTAQCVLRRLSRPPCSYGHVRLLVCLVLCLRLHVRPCRPWFLLGAELVGCRRERSSPTTMKSPFGGQMWPPSKFLAQRDQSAIFGGPVVYPIHTSTDPYCSLGTCSCLPMA